MSRTYKDRKAKLQFPEDYNDLAYKKITYTKAYINTYGDYNEYDAYWYMPVAGFKVKKKRSNPGRYFWYRSTPGWFVRLVMNKPARRAAKLAERKVLFSDIEDFDFVDTKRKPNIYYW